MLTKQELADIKTLQEICEKKGSFRLKLNFDMLENRKANYPEDFFHYEEGTLVGFLASYEFGNKVELCGMVHPEYRRKGIFSKLLNTGLAAVKKQGATAILLNAPTTSQSAKEFLEMIPCRFSIAEYQMKWQESELSADKQIGIRPSLTEEDAEAEIQLDVLCFGLNEMEARSFKDTIKDGSNEERMIIETEGQIAGKIRVAKLGGEAWIYGFAIFPELQGKGIGRAALTKVVAMEHQKGLPVFLEVEAKNKHALKLYESCGFKVYHSQDYYLYMGYSQENAELQR